MKCKKCGVKIKKGEEAYINTKSYCQYCIHKIKHPPTTIPGWLLAANANRKNSVNIRDDLGCKKCGRYLVIGKGRPNKSRLCSACSTREDTKNR